MMSSTIASKLPVSAASRADVPSPRATTSMPSAVSPRATAVRIPGSSSTTNTRAIAAEPTRRRQTRSTTSEVSQSRCVTLSAHGHQENDFHRTPDRGRRCRDRRRRPGPARGTGRGRRGRRSCRRSRPRNWSARCWPRKKEPFAGTVEMNNGLGLPALPDAPQAANGTSTARVWSNGDAGGPGPAAHRRRRAHPGLRRDDVLGLELRGPHGRHRAPGGPTGRRHRVPRATRPPRPTRR